MDMSFRRVTLWVLETRVIFFLIVHSSCLQGVLVVQINWLSLIFEENPDSMLIALKDCANHTIIQNAFALFYHYILCSNCLHLHVYGFRDSSEVLCFLLHIYTPFLCTSMSKCKRTMPSKREVLHYHPMAPRPCLPQSQVRQLPPLCNGGVTALYMGRLIVIWWPACGCFCVFFVVALCNGYCSKLMTMMTAIHSIFYFILCKV